MLNSPYANKLDMPRSKLVWAQFWEILDRAQVPSHLRIFHQRWVERWLREPHLHQGIDDPAQRFAKSLQACGLPDWQCRQAQRSVSAWIKAFDQIVGSLVDSPAVRTPSSWAEVIRDMQDALRIQNYSPRTMESYGMWVDRFAKRFPEVPVDGDQASQAVDAFLAELALSRNLARASIDQARNAFAWLFRRRLGFELHLAEKGTAHRGRRIPMVISATKVKELLAHCPEPWDLFFGLQYGCGFRLMELLELRVREVDLDRRVITVRHGKGDADRQCLLPQVLHQRLVSHLADRKELWRSDLDAASPRWTYLPADIRHPAPPGNGSTCSGPAALCDIRTRAISAAGIHWRTRSAMSSGRPPPKPESLAPSTHICCDIASRPTCWKREFPSKPSRASWVMHVCRPP